MLLTIYKNIQNKLKVFHFLLGIDKKIVYLCTIIKIRDMEEDNTQYFNDEWNNMRPSDFVEKYTKILNKDGEPQDIILREIDKEFINNYYKNKDADKHTK